MIAIAFGCSKGRTCTETTTDTNGNVDTSIRVYDKLSPSQRRDIENLSTYTDGNGKTHITSCK